MSNHNDKLVERRWEILSALEEMGYNFRVDIDNIEDDERDFEDLTDHDIDWLGVWMAADGEDLLNEAEEDNEDNEDIG